MKITVLGCGSSGGVPLVGNDWGTCDPNEPRNRRTRVSILVEQGDTTLLVDTSPDMRQQLLDCQLTNLTAVLYTHSHADHCHGIDDLRGVNWLTKKPVDIYADSKTMSELEQRFSYVFNPAEHFYKPAVHAHRIDGPFAIGGIDVVPFMQNHGYVHSLGFRFGDFAYSTDVKTLDEAAFQTLAGIKVWIVDCVREAPHPTHSHLAQTLEWIARVKPARAFLTHMNHMMDYADIMTKLPPGVWPAHDGLIIEC
ncbi:MAG: MBL fold metallo-hydrolase [Pseudomonadota bacterium]|nr:MBL fold metallo-hydrolase [Pseudomonadota bacterium]